MNPLQFSGLLFLALTATGIAGAYEANDSREHYIEWSDFNAAPSDWKPSDSDDLHVLTIGTSAEVTFAVEYHANVGLNQAGLSAIIRICHNKDCSFVDVPSAEIPSGTLKDSIQSIDLAKGVNEYSYTIFLWNDGKLLDSDTTVYYVSRY